jgi:protein-L-isoaspartate(D-aspartate) O-methyltransferase
MTRRGSVGLVCFGLGWIVGFLPGELPAVQDTFALQRQRLVEDIILPGGIKDPRVVEAIRQTPRHEFVDAAHRQAAYADMALPIGEGQTISSPYIVAVMTEVLDPQPTDRVLEIGTGSGYQAAVLAPLVDQVYTIEIVESLGRQAERVLKRLGYDNVHVRLGDGFKGWPEAAPFDKIIVTCSPEDVPTPLVEQLAEGGLMVIPVGERYQQTLTLMRKKDGELQRQALRPTLFVPMTGRAEAERQVVIDPRYPALVNGDFEEPAEDPEQPPGWYYGRGIRLTEDDRGPSGRTVAEFSNSVTGQPTLLIQGLALDGRHVRRVRLSGHVWMENVQPGKLADELPMIGLQILDEKRQRIAHYWLGPWQGSNRWRKETRILAVPGEAREALLSIGLFGATGTVRFDALSIEALGR